MTQRAALALVAACGWGTMSPKEFESEFGIAPRIDDAPEINVFAAPGFTGCLERLETAVGTHDVHATNLELFPMYIRLQARTPQDTAATYTCRHGEVGKPEQLSAYYARDTDTFSFSQVALDRLPALIATAPGHSGLERAKVTHVEITVDRAKHAPRIYITINGRGRDLTLEYDAQANDDPDNAARIAPPTAPRPATLTAATLGGAMLPTNPVRLDDVNIPALGVFDPLSFDWPRSIARAWQADAALVHLVILNPTPEGMVDLVHVSDRNAATYGFRSASCTSAGHGPCVLVLDVIANHGDSPSATVVGRDDWTGAIREVPCSLHAAISKLAESHPSEHTDRATLELVAGQPRWTIHTFDGYHGTTHDVSGASCKALP